MRDAGNLGKWIFKFEGSDKDTGSAAAALSHLNEAGGNTKALLSRRLLFWSWLRTTFIEVLV
jgi:hypothetical protein